MYAHSQHIDDQPHHKLRNISVRADNALSDVSFTIPSFRKRALVETNSKKYRLDHLAATTKHKSLDALACSNLTLSHTSPKAVASVNRATVVPGHPVLLLVTVGSSNSVAVLMTTTVTQLKMVGRGVLVLSVALTLVLMVLLLVPVVVAFG